MNRQLYFYGVLVFVLLAHAVFAQTPVEKNGQLQVIGVQLCNEDGYPVQLRGMSSHGLQWYGDCVNQTTIGQLKNDWGADVVRLAMYVEEGGYTQSRSTTEWKAYIKQRVDWLVDAGLYCIIDWHVHIPGDPLVYVNEAVDFFDYFSELYKNTPNVIFEICNEPNKVAPNNSGWDDAMWSNHIKPFAEQVIPVIRANNPNAVVLVGNPIWSSKPGDILDDPLTGNNAEDVLYSFHFYGGSHYSQAYINQYSDKIPIFMNEWGTSINKGNYGNDYVNTQAWFDLMSGNNPGTQLMSWCNWSLCDKTESSAALAPGACNNDVNQTSESGAFVKAEMSKADNFITAPVALPKFAVQPFAQSVVEGTSAYLRVKAVGAGTLEYQWYKDGNAVAGANEATLIIKGFSVANVGLYKVQVTNHMGSSMSRSVQVSLDVQSPQGNAPWSLPGIVEIENYDEGGDGISFNDLKHPDASEAGSFGSPPVAPISVVDGDGFSDALAGLAYNDWVEYTVTFTESGFYTFIAHAYSEENAPEIPQFWIALDGVKQTKIKDIPTTYSWTDAYSDTVWVESGTYVMQILIEERLGRNSFDSFLFDYINVVKQNIDCNGDEDGTASIDQCGICSGGNTGVEPAVDSDGDGVYDCNDLCPDDGSKTEPGVCGCGVVEGDCDDCAGVWGGTAMVDDCNVCSGGDTGIEPNESCTDCFGTINGTAEIDNCGVCSGGLTGIVRNETCTDCAGILNGTAFIDDCGVCVEGTTGLIENESCADCEGVPNGTAEKDVCGVCKGDGTSCTGILTPYKGDYLKIPGRIEAEHFNAGGEGVAYHDADAGNSGGVFRTEDGVDVAIEGTGYSIGWIANGEWTTYSVEVLYSGEYTLEFYCGGVGDNKTITVEIGALTFDVTIANTNSFSAFATVQVFDVALVAGEYTMTVKYNADGFNLDYIDFIPEALPDCAGVPGGDAYVDNCGICVGGTTGLLPSPDSDNDGVADCSDLCPDDPLKINPGNCGCGVAENDCPDCNGDLGGTAAIDDCNVCAGGNTGIVPNSTCTDCNGQVNGSASIDDCGVCSGGTTGILPNSTCVDCNDVLNGTAEIDDCNVCAGGNTGIEPNTSCPCPGEGDLDECGVCGGDGSTCAGIQTPYLGYVRYIPGSVQAEDYDAGGEDVAFHDSDANHQGSANYRTDAVDLDIEGTDNYSISYINEAEYLEYTMEVLYTGNYTLKIGLSSPSAGNTIDLYAGSMLLAEDVVVPVTGGYHSFQYAEINGVALTKGVHIFKVLFHGSGYNLDDIVFESEFSIDCNGDVDGTAYVDNCEVCVGGNTGLDECSAFLLELEQGWNLISFNLVFKDPAIEVVFAPVLDNIESLKSCSEYYIPGQASEFQSLTEAVVGKGYLINMSQATSVELYGSALSSFNIDLRTGWNLIGFPLFVAKDISTALTSISDKVLEVRNFQGEWIGNGTGNTLSNFEPGKAYYIYVTEDCTISF